MANRSSRCSALLNVLDIVVGAGVVSVGAAILRGNLWRAVLFVAPASMRVEIDDPAEKMMPPPELEALSRQLIQMGFKPLGSRFEKPVFAAGTTSYDYVHGADQVYATLYEGQDRNTRLYFLTPIEPDGFVMTSNFRRPAKDVPGRYLTGALEEFPLERLLKAHLRRAEAFKPRGDFSPEARVVAAREWFAGPGRGEIRQQNFAGLLWSLGTIGMVSAILFGRK